MPRFDASAPAPLRVAAELAGASERACGRGWLIELVVELEGTILDPEYWLCHCRGFLVNSEAGVNLGVVDEIELAPGSERAAALAVAGGWFGRHETTVDIARVQAIVPSERRLIVRDSTSATDT